MNPHEYLCPQLRLEGKEIVDENLLRQVEAVPGEDLPLMIVALLENQKQVSYYAESLPTVLFEELLLRSAAVRFPKVDPILQFLDSLDIKADVGHYKTYIFSDQDTSFSSKDVREYSHSNPLVQEFRFEDFAEKVFAIERDGKIVSACVSVRENGERGEAWVYTGPEYRNRGFAQQVVYAWAHQMMKSGKIPFYSHAIENIASANLAKRLGLQPVFEEVNISYKNV